MAATLRLEIVTPDATAYSEDVEMVTLTGAEGELGVYPNHVPLLTTLRPGELRVLKGGHETFLAVGEGFVEVRGDGVSVLTDVALEASSIDESAAVDKAPQIYPEIASAEPCRTQLRIHIPSS